MLSTVCRKVQPFLRRLGDNRAARRSALLVIVLVLIVFWAQSVRKSLRPEGSDFSSYLEAADMLRKGESPYRLPSRDLRVPQYFPFSPESEITYRSIHIFPPRYPLFLPFVLSPFLLIERATTVFLWPLFLIAALMGVAQILRKEIADRVQPSDANRLWLPFFLAVLIFLPVLQNNLINGQINLWALLFCLLFYRSQQTGQETLSALFLALAVSLKIVPALLLMYLAWRKKWKAALLTVLFTLLLGLSPALLAGSRIFGMYADFFHTTVTPYAMQGLLDHTHSLDFSLYAFLASVQPSLSGNGVVEWLSIAAVLLLLLWEERRSAESRGSSLRMVSLYLLALLLMNPISENHHLIFALPLLTLLLSRSIEDDSPAASAAGIGAAAFTLLFYTARAIEYHPFFFAALVVLWLAANRLEENANPCSRVME